MMVDRRLNRRRQRPGSRTFFGKPKSIARSCASNSELVKSITSRDASRISENGVGRRAVRRPVIWFSSNENCVLNLAARRIMLTLSGMQTISIVSTP